MKNKIIFKYGDGTATLFSVEPPKVKNASPLLIEINQSMAQYLKNVERSDRHEGFKFDGGGFFGFDNAWCMFYCSGCFCPMQISRQYWHDVFGGIREPYPRKDLNAAHFRSYPPLILPSELEGNSCWHSWKSGKSCLDLPG